MHDIACSTKAQAICSRRLVSTPHGPLPCRRRSGLPRPVPPSSRPSPPLCFTLHPPSCSKARTGADTVGCVGAVRAGDALEAGPLCLPFALPAASSCQRFARASTPSHCPREDGVQPWEEHAGLDSRWAPESGASRAPCGLALRFRPLPLAPPALFRLALPLVSLARRNAGHQNPPRDGHRAWLSARTALASFRLKLMILSVPRPLSALVAQRHSAKPL